MMEKKIKLDLKDRKILYELDNNSRQSYAKIGKKTGLSKDTVLYRVNRLIENGVITKFYTRIDSFKLGYNTIRFYLIFQNTTKDIEKQIIDYFTKENKYILFCGSIEGRFDLVVNVWVKNFNEFYAFLKSVFCVTINTPDEIYTHGDTIFVHKVSSLEIILNSGSFIQLIKTRL